MEQGTAIIKLDSGIFYDKQEQSIRCYKKQSRLNN